jgi:hypothetical protein
MLDLAASMTRVSFQELVIDGLRLTKTSAKGYFAAEEIFWKHETALVEVPPLCSLSTKFYQYTACQI